MTIDDSQAKLHADVYRSVERMRLTLGVIQRYGARTTRDAASALRRGEASPTEQRIVAELLDALRGGETC